MKKTVKITWYILATLILLNSPIFHHHYNDIRGGYTTHYSIAQNIQMDISEHVFTLPTSIFEDIL